MAQPVFQEFQKSARLTRECTITEKIDGTNASIFIGENGEFLTGSCNRWITPQDDNFGFAKWAQANRDELMLLGTGHHFGEWWGSGIQRRYGLAEKRFSLFNVSRWNADTPPPKCCLVVPVLYIGMFATDTIQLMLDLLASTGSHAAPWFMKPEGVIVYHHTSHMYFKKTIEKDDEYKGNSR